MGQEHGAATGQSHCSDPARIHNTIPKKNVQEKTEYEEILTEGERKRFTSFSKSAQCILQIQALSITDGLPCIDDMPRDNQKQATVTTSCSSSGRA